MDRYEQDGATVRIPPPLAYLGALLLGLALQAFVLPLPLTLPLVARIGVTVAAGLASLVLMAAAYRPFQRTGQDPKPWKSTPEIISTGVYRYTRNPMYISMALLQAALGFGLANGWILVLILPVLVIIHFTAIRHEEVYLEQKFGAAYVQYRSSVRRWL